MTGALGLYGCGDREAPASATAAGDRAPLASPGGTGGAELPSASRAMRITSEMSVAVDDVDGAVSALRNAATDTGGYVSDAKVSGAGSFKIAALELKIPTDRLGSFRDTIAATGRIESESQKAEDVTEQRADLKARVRNAKAQEKRLLELLSDRTGSLADVIAAEKSLAEVRELVERLEAQDTTLDRQIAFATVKLSLGPNREVEAVGAGDRISGAFSRGITLAGQALVGAAVAIGTAGPTVAVFALFAYLMFRIVRAVHERTKPK
ncbi:MAG: DUF4349 domain-containing protein, partial [Myxococcales bacterium]|nr:DUF4349 domain-containing protein [Myxococcales bacterium]